MQTGERDEREAALSSAKVTLDIAGEKLLTVSGVSAGGASTHASARSASSHESASDDGASGEDGEEDGDEDAQAFFSNIQPSGF